MSTESLAGAVSRAVGDAVSAATPEQLHEELHPASTDSVWALAVSRNDEWVIDSVYPSEGEASDSIPIIGEGRVVPLRFGQTLAGALGEVTNA